MITSILSLSSKQLKSSKLKHICNSSGSDVTTPVQQLKLMCMKNTAGFKVLEFKLMYTYKLSAKTEKLP